MRSMSSAGTPVTLAPCSSVHGSSDAWNASKPLVARAMNARFSRPWSSMTHATVFARAPPVPTSSGRKALREVVHLVGRLRAREEAERVRPVPVHARADALGGARGRLVPRGGPEGGTLLVADVRLGEAAHRALLHGRRVYSAERRG